MSEVERLLDYYLTAYAVKRGWTESTVVNKTHRLHKFFETVKVKKLKQIDNKVYDEWLGDLMSRGLKASTVGQEITVVRTFLLYLRGKGCAMPIDLTEIVVRKAGYTDRHAYTEAEIRYMLSFATNDRDWLILALGFYGGLRRFEIAKLEKSEISDRTLSFYGKGKKKGVVVLPVDVADRLDSFCGENDSRYVFPSPHKRKRHTHIHVSTVHERVKKVAKRAGFDGFHIHQTRYSLATEMKNRGVKLMYIQKALRHASAKTTELYIQWDLSEYVEAYDQAFPQFPSKLALT
jgi:integrase/recombinase XerC